ncbi:MAG: hypothetical protein C0504_15060 [Candidatus Solibacter sp.]|nr:hypothetical protein [Candidatus Solibacter sp.]
MKVKVKFSRWDTGYPVRGSAAPKAIPEDEPAQERWQSPPRYEVRGGETNDKVVPIRVEPPAQRAEVLPIRPGKSRDPEVVTPAELVQALTQLLNPASVLAVALGGWALSADFGAAHPFAVADGPFSRWQVWLAVAGVIQFANHRVRKRFCLEAEPRESSVTPGGDER